MGPFYDSDQYATTRREGCLQGAIVPSIVSFQDATLCHGVHTRSVYAGQLHPNQLMHRPSDDMHGWIDMYASKTIPIHVNEKGRLIEYRTSPRTVNLNRNLTRFELAKELAGTVESVLSMQEGPKDSLILSVHYETPLRGQAYLVVNIVRFEYPSLPDDRGRKHRMN